MKLLSISELINSPLIIEEIRWDVTPKIFINPAAYPDKKSGKGVDITYGYMLFVDLMDDKPALVIMQLRSNISKTVGYIMDAPEGLLRESMDCVDSDCIGGMYPLSGKLVAWLKKEFGIS